MKNHLVAIKLGGGLITDKTKPYTARQQYIDLFAHELQALRDAHPSLAVLVGNGAGSYAHFSAHEYGLREGAHSPRQRYGVAVTHNGVRRLNGLVSDTLVRFDIPAFALSPAGTMLHSHDAASPLFAAPVRHLLAKGYVPVVHGDTILDDERGTTIYSTERVFQAYLEVLRADYERITVIYLTTTDGVLDAHGQRIPTLAPNATVTVHTALSHDVTGGIEGKVASARTATTVADDVYIISGTTAGGLGALLAGEHAGTKILP
jgi:isopentenyl phosphate kinase